MWNVCSVLALILGLFIYSATLDGSKISRNLASNIPAKFSLLQSFQSHSKTELTSPVPSSGASAASPISSSPPVPVEVKEKKAAPAPTMKYIPSDILTGAIYGKRFRSSPTARARFESVQPGQNNPFGSPVKFQKLNPSTEYPQQESLVPGNVKATLTRGDAMLGNRSGFSFTGEVPSTFESKSDWSTGEIKDWLLDVEAGNRERAIATTSLKFPYPETQKFIQTHFMSASPFDFAGQVGFAKGFAGAYEKDREAPGKERLERRKAASGQ